MLLLFEDVLQLPVVSKPAKAETRANNRGYHWAGEGNREGRTVLVTRLKLPDGFKLTTETVSKDQGSDSFWLDCLLQDRDAAFW